MKNIKQDINIDLEINSSPWTVSDLMEFRQIMKKIKSKKNKPIQVSFRQVSSV